jgi:tetratricopeptide (TPR) repeat protein
LLYRDIVGFFQKQGLERTYEKAIRTARSPLLRLRRTAYSQTAPSVRRTPNTPATFWKASVTAETNKDYAAAIQQLTGFQQAGGDPFLLNLRAGWLYYLAQDYKNASDRYNQAARLQPSAITPLLGLLNVAQARADATEIRKAVEAVLRVDPINYTAQMAGASLQFKAQNYRESLSYYRRVLQYYPDDLAARSGEAWSLYHQGRRDLATTDFQILLSVNPDYPEARQGLDLAQGKTTAQLTENP